VNTFKYFLSDDFTSQKNLDADIILFVRRFKLIFMGKKDSIPEILQGGLLVQSPVKGLAKEMKVRLQM
jgi:hypothetical protein